MGVNGNDNCGFTDDVSTDFWGNWKTANQSVATVDTHGMHTGVAAGSTNSSTQGKLLSPYGRYQCTNQAYTPTGGDNVQKPTSLKVLSVTVLPNGAGPPNGCPPSANYGIMVDIKYQVLDQNSKAIALSSMTPHETGTYFDGSPLNSDIGPAAGYPTSSQTTASDGTFHDVPFGVCSSLPLSNPGLTATQNITVVMPGGSSFSVRSQTATVTAPGSASFGHGTLKNNITSPGTGSDINATR